MPSFTTMYRAIVMVAAGVIVVKGWQLYGPTSQQVKSFGARALESAQTAWNNWQPGVAEPAAATADPRLAAAPIAPTVPPPVVEPAPLFSPAPTQIEDRNPSPGQATDPLPQFYSRLEALGASNPQLAPWGSSGQMYRFSCRAELTESSTASRHFEAVAAEPVAAVEQVVAKVEAWRAAQHKVAALR